MTETTALIIALICYISATAAGYLLNQALANLNTGPTASAGARPIRAHQAPLDHWVPGKSWN